MKVFSVKFINVVVLDGSQISWLTLESSIRNVNRSIEINPELGGIQVSSDTDSIFVPFHNVSYLRLESKSTEEINNSKKVIKPEGVKASEIKRPGR
jgi:hypothetical protein